MYQIVYDSRIGKDIRTIPANILKLIFKKIETLRANPRVRGIEKLTSIEGWRLRVGTYRILYQIDDSEKTIKVYRIKHRKEVYR